MTTHQQSVQDQFNATSEGHGADLLQACEHVAAISDQLQSVVDLGCGAGHLSYALANTVPHITAVDAALAMIQLVTHETKERGLDNITPLQASVESLPFETHSIDLICSRYSAHHWTDMTKAAHEIKRVIKPNGFLMMIDIEGFANPIIDTHFQTIELLRDRSHVRNYSDKEWRAWFNAVGYEVTHHSVHPIRLDFQSWVARMQTPTNKIDMIQHLQQEAS
ncbi:MAG: class I SAM-dependent methyltransferase, partial [Gammaproteobacteria bacterium]